MFKITDKSYYNIISTPQNMHITKAKRIALKNMLDSNNEQLPYTPILKKGSTNERL